MVENRKRKIISFGDSFEKFLLGLDRKAQDKLYVLFELIETLDHIPRNLSKSVAGVPGLFEIRLKLASSIWRIFCLFDKGNVVVLLSGFSKKTSKIPRKELEKAKRLMAAYKEEIKK